MSDLLPCPFCGGGETRIDENTHWTGMRSVLISASVMHWCDHEKPAGMIKITGKTVDLAIERWNTRALLENDDE